MLQDECEVNFMELGRWWGTNPKTKRQEEIDILGVEDNNTALFGECKWKNEKVDTGVLETLVERSNIFHYNRKHYYLFSKSGFTGGCVELAQQMGNVTLVSYEQMMEH